ncbi:hypothetical protein [Costertonia aggregata]|uniref:Carboxypeptidase regulatory-like domain-containing protein n=1 Tax=Costertonia aggregata TaxID=343403 RepID=A0A7H9ATL1_9FLAO|nr:hypothetical protein [Costertonia aggregata]QLG46823.1 hypothetical protein HYG79_16180 [Costertonia aggregata]
MDNAKNFSYLVNTIGQEEVYVHLNTSFFLVGEYMYYSIYTKKASNNRLSDLSKVAYIELVGENGLKVFKHKVFLVDGLGQGDFFLPVSVPSGNYKLIGYTQWMTNWGIDSFFQTDVVVINPYTNDQKALLPDSAVLDGSLVAKENPKNSNRFSDLNMANTIKLDIDSKQFSKRKKVALKLSTNELDFLNGNYSISVRKKDSILLFGKTNPHNAQRKRSENNVFREDINLPELRGDLIIGRLLSKSEEANIENKKILFSIPGEEYIFKVLTTNEFGRFLFSLDKHLVNSNAIFQVLGSNSENYEIILEDIDTIDYDKIKFSDFHLKPIMKEQILQRSIHNQIENAYFEIKPDTVKINEERLPFYGNADIVYNLDDYTRFKTVKETFVEIISNVWITYDKNGSPLLSVRSLQPLENQTAYKSLVIVDGLALKDIQPLLEFDSRKIESIKIIRDKYVLGSQIFQGIVDIQTLENEFNENHKPEYFNEITLSKPLVPKKYFKQSYDNKQADVEKGNIPDYRHQLLWLPNFKFNSSKETIEFYTSDVTGDFEICIEGFTKNGTPVSLREMITVE